MEKSSLKYLLATLLISTSLCSFAAEENNIPGTDTAAQGNVTLPEPIANATAESIANATAPGNATLSEPIVGTVTEENINIVDVATTQDATAQTTVTQGDVTTQDATAQTTVTQGDANAIVVQDTSKENVASAYAERIKNLTAEQNKLVLPLVVMDLNEEIRGDIANTALDTKLEVVAPDLLELERNESQKLRDQLQQDPALKQIIIGIKNAIRAKTKVTNEKEKEMLDRRINLVPKLVQEKLQIFKGLTLNKIERFQELVNANTPYSAIESALGKDFITQVIALDKSENGALKKLYDSNTNTPWFASWTSVSPSEYRFASPDVEKTAYDSSAKAALEYLNTQGFVLPQSAVPAPTIAEQVSTMPTEQIAANLEQISAASEANSASNSTEPAAGAASGEATPEQPATDGTSAQEEGTNPNPAAPGIDLLADVSMYDITKQLVEKLTPVQRAELASIKTAESLKDFLDKNKQLLNYLVNKTFDDLQNVRKQDLAQPGLYNMDLLHDQFLNNATVLTFFAEEAHTQAKESSKQDLRKKFLNKKETFKEFGDSFFPAKPAVSMADTEQGSDQSKNNEAFRAEAANILRSAVRFERRLADVKKRFGRPSSTGGASGSGAVFGTSAADSALNK